MANELLQLDPVGSFLTGQSQGQQLKLRQQQIDAQPLRNELANIQLQGAKQGLEQGAATFKRQGVLDQRSDALNKARFGVQMFSAIKGLPQEQRLPAFQSLAGKGQELGIDFSLLDQPLTDEFLDQEIRDGTTIINSLTSGEQFTLSPGQTRFSGGKPIASVPKEPTNVSAEVPGELLIGLDRDTAIKGAAAFRAAGGGKDGLKAFNEIIKGSDEKLRREDSPEILRANFPTASPAELTQLQATMDAAKTTESGLKAAEKTREKQEKMKKAQQFQDRALDLMDRILGADPDVLAGVLGSVEGNIDFRLFSDAQAELIADIKEAKDILTSDNMKLMSGVLSETDIKILANLAGGALERTRSQDRFVRDLTEMRNRMQSKRALTVDDKAAIKQQETQALLKNKSDDELLDF